MITVVGGRSELKALADARWHRCECVQFRSGLPRQEYAAILTEARHQILTPGLATILECWATRSTPLFQPGFNKSMLLQLDDVMATGYPHAIPWPWHSAVGPTLRSLEQDAALQLLMERIGRSVRSDADFSEAVEMAVRAYVRAEDRTVIPIQPPPVGLPDGPTELRRHLLRLVTSRGHELRAPGVWR
jgi:hypothetical protein